MKHLSIRVPWHDHGWDGTICQDPKGNSACLALNLVAEMRDDEAEQKNPGATVEALKVMPPCVRERSAFLAGRPINLPVVMPYSVWSDHHKHILPSAVELPAWGGVMVPYRWMLRQPAWDLARDYGLNADPNREPSDEPFPQVMIDSAWVQDADNQRALLDGFADQLVPEESLIFFYAKRTPLSEGIGRPIVAVASLEHVGVVDEYPYRGGAAGGRIRSMVWERPFQHSLRRTEKGFAGGVVLPYQELHKRTLTHPDLDPTDYLAFPPPETADEFLYGSEHVSHGSAISALQAVRNSVEKFAELMDGPWDDAISWIDTKINEIWKLRGPAPGLGSALTCIEPLGFNGTLFAHALGSQLPDDADPWPVIAEVFDGKRPAPFAGPQLTGLIKKRFQLIRDKKPEHFALMQMLSRFEVTKAQAIAAYEADNPLRAVKNPYALYEESRFWEKPIPLGIIDHGLFGGGPIKGAWPLPAETEVNVSENDDALRLRAVSVYLLEQEAAKGNTLAAGDELAPASERLALSPVAPIDDIALELLEDDFYPTIHVHKVGEKHFAQLERYVDAGEIIRRHVEARIENKPEKSDVDWHGELEEEELLGPAPEGDALEEAARNEKAHALAVLADSRIAVLTGPAGSGKTTLLRALLQQRDLVGADIELLAPTGKARVRLGQQTKMHSRARTLAQFLLQHERWNPLTNEYSFSQTGNTAKVSTCVVDEASMLTEDQLAALLSALPKAARLVLVGDPRQLPPIGAGRPFVDLIAHLRGKCAGAHLAELQISRRQNPSGEQLNAMALADVQLAELFSGREPGPAEGEHLQAVTNDKRLSFEEWDTPTKLRTTVGKVLTEQLALGEENLEQAIDRSLGASSEDHVPFRLGAGSSADNWQILTPHRDLPNGSAELNRLVKRVGRARWLNLARKLEPGMRIVEARGPDQITYGDKVICLRNHRRYSWNPDRGDQEGYLANGEVGVVIGGTGSHTTYTNVEFSTQPNESFGFKRKEFGDHGSPLLELGYAVTIHKAQGSEFKSVILVLPASSQLLSRELLYTALTRQRDRIWILHQGSFSAFTRLRSDFYSETARRVTNLFAEPTMREIAAPPGASVAERPRFLEDKLIHATRRGDLVRSKNEIVIADILHEIEQQGAIRYSVEKPLMLDGVERWPDFTIEAGSEVWYWEHCGMLGDPQYRARWELKKASYQKEGISIWSEGNPSGRLIVTEDNATTGLDSGALHRMASSLWPVS
jgi:hypothetical protein